MPPALRSALRSANPIRSVGAGMDDNRPTQSSDGPARTPRTRGPKWLREGDDPDYRFSLANERTFLAWIRTSLAMIAGAVAVVQLVPPFNVSGGRGLLGAVLAVCGLGIASTAYFRWSANE